MRVRKSAEERRAEIVAAALRLAAEVGPDRLTTEVIAQAVGLTQPAVFRHFPRKQDIWLAVAAWMAEAFQARWREVAQAPTAPERRVRDLAVAQLDMIQSTPAIPAILFSRELHVENEALRQSLFGLMRRFHGLVVGLVEEARHAGAFRSDLDPDAAALLVISVIQGQAVRWSLSGHAFDLVVQGQSLLDVLLGGFARPEPFSDR